MNPEKLQRLPTILFEVGKAIGSDENLATLLARISELVCDLVDAEACSIMLLDTARERLLGKAAYGLARRDVTLISFRVGEGVAGWVAAHGEPARIDDVLEISAWVSRIGTTSFTLSTEMRRAGETAVLVTTETTYVHVDHKTFTKRAIAPEMRAALEDGARSKVADHAGFAS